jgi:hypothetical protein
MRQSQMMLDEWNQSRGRIFNSNQDDAKLALHVASMACFKKPMQWSDDAQGPPPGHSLSYQSHQRCLQI